jgi:hypothetical protein
VLKHGLKTWVEIIWRYAMAYIYNSENGVVKVSEILLLLSFQLGFQQSYQQLSTWKK